MKCIFFRLAFLLIFVMSLNACGSSVNLKTVPVEDRPPTGTSLPRPPAAVPESAVAPIEVGRDDSNPLESQMDGPTGVAKLIYFDYDSFLIKPEFQSVVAAHAKYLVAYPNRKIAVEGHTDERGGREYNLALGQRRAEAVRTALGLSGVREDQVEAVSFGEEKPAVAGFTEEAYAQNRRAEIFYR